MKSFIMVKLDIETLKKPKKNTCFYLSGIFLYVVTARHDPNYEWFCLCDKMHVTIVSPRE
jgi:hypothetical protein